MNESTTGTNGGGMRFVVSGNSTEPLVIEQFGDGIKIDHRCSRPVVIKDGLYYYTSSAGAGDLYLKDVEINNFALQSGSMSGRDSSIAEARAPKLLISAVLSGFAA